MKIQLMKEYCNSPALTFMIIFSLRDGSFSLGFLLFLEDLGIWPFSNYLSGTTVAERGNVVLGSFTMHLSERGSAKGRKE